MFGRRKEKKEKVKITKESLRKALRLGKYLRPHRLSFSIGLFFLLFSSVTSMLFPGLMGQLVDAQEHEKLIPGLPFEGVNGVAFALFIVFALQAIFSYFRIYIFADVTQRMVAQLRMDTYSRLIRLPLAFFNSRRIGELNSRLASDITLVQEAFTVDLAEFIRQLLTILVGIVFLCFYSYKLTLVMLGSLPVMMIIAVFFGRFIKKLSKKTQDEVAESNTIIEETLTGIQTVKAFVAEWRETKRYGVHVQKIQSLAMQAARWRGAFASFIIFCMFGAIVLVIWYGAILKNQGEISTGDLFSFVLYSVFVGASFGGIADIYSRIQKAIGATENVFDLLEESTEAESFQTGDQQLAKTEVLTIEGLGFSYPSRGDLPILSDINLEVKKGETLALVGPSGSGKTTLLSLLYRFYEPQTGVIKINGESITQESLEDYRSRMAIVAQDVLLFGGTIRENIAYGKPEATESEIESAARDANAWDFIQSFPEGLDTLVGERGIQVSGGQRQRIAIARAIIKNPEILLLDEATSSLDSESEKEVQEALDRAIQNRTTIVVAHRLSTIKNADQIAVIQEGRIIETGTHESLVSQENGVYKNLKELQMN